MKKTKIFTALVLAAAALFTFAACGEVTADPTDNFKITFSPSSVDVTANAGITVDGTSVTVTRAGTYEISGTCAEGKITVNAPDVAKIRFILCGVDLSNTSSSVINVVSAKRLYIELKDGTENSLSDVLTGERADDAVIYSKSDITISGSGSLDVTAHHKNGIATSDDLVIESGVITVSAVNNGMKGKDSVTVEGGTVYVDAENDGIKSTKDTDPVEGFIEIKGGDIHIIAADEALSAFTYFSMSGGTLTVDTENNGIKAGRFISITGGTVNITTADDDLTAPSVTGTADADVTVNGLKIYFK